MTQVTKGFLCDHCGRGGNYSRWDPLCFGITEHVQKKDVPTPHKNPGSRQEKLFADSAATHSFGGLHVILGFSMLNSVIELISVNCTCNLELGCIGPATRPELCPYISWKLKEPKPVWMEEHGIGMLWPQSKSEVCWKYASFRLMFMKQFLV